MVKSPAQKSSRCIVTSIYFFIFILRTEVNSQTVHLDPMGIQSVSTCSSGLRNGIDFYIFKGIVDATIAKHSNLVDFDIKPTSSNSFDNLCTASLQTCFTPNPQPCYCGKQNGTIYEIYANRSAVVSHSNALIRIRWDSSSAPSVFSNELQVPTIYDLNAVTTSLTQGKDVLTCPATVANGSSITFECKNSPSPCGVSITMDNTVVATQETSATYRVISNLTSNSSQNFKFSYSVCGAAETHYPCNVTIVIVPATCSLNFTAWDIALFVIYCVDTLAIIFTSIAIFVFVIKADKETVNFCMCHGFLVFAVVLDIILIIFCALAQTSTCDPGLDSQLALWKILLIIFCIVIGLLIAVAAVIVRIFIYSKSSQQRTGSNRGSAEITPHTNVSAPNIRTQKENKVKNDRNANTW